MNLTINGNNVYLTFAAADPIPIAIPLPDGYSFEILNITDVSNIAFFNYAGVEKHSRLVYPSVNSKSPCTMQGIYKKDDTQKAAIRFCIEKFGQIPDTHYFDSAFEPILIVGNDGNEYNVIPSDQFK